MSADASAADRGILLLHMRTHLVLSALLFTSALLAIPGTGNAQEDLPEVPVFGDDGQPGAASDASTPDYLAALELQRKGRFQSAQRAFLKVLKRFPDSVHTQDMLL